jgi:DNA repair protein RecO (recombination protein O)
MSRHERIRAIIFKRTNIGEADKILTLYTRERGKVRCVAKGSRRPSSKLVGHLDIFNISEINLVKGRSLDIITGCRTINDLSYVKQDLLATSQLYLIAEMIHYLIHDEQKDETLFDVLEHSLATADEIIRQENGDIRYQISMLTWATCTKILDCLGVFPQTDMCVSCREPINQNSPKLVMHERGEGLLCVACATSQPQAYLMDREAIKLLRILQREPLERSIHIQVSDETQDAFGKLFTGMIAYQLEKESQAQRLTKTIVGLQEVQYNKR